MEKRFMKNKMTIGAALLLVATCVPVLALAETDRLTVEDPATGAVKFKVTSDGNVSGSSIVAQQAATEPLTTAKITVKDAAGVDKASLYPNGSLDLTSEAVSPTLLLTNATETAGQAPTFVGRKAHGSPTAPSAVQAGDNLFTLSGLGYYGVAGAGGNWHFASTAIFMPARETFTATAKGADIGFLTTAPGTTSRTEKFRITGEGNVGIGTSVPGQKLEVNGGVRLNTATGKPACTTTTRGTFWVTQNATNDLIEVCAMVSGSLVWKGL